MFGIFANDTNRTVIGYARLNQTSGLFEYSNIIYDSSLPPENVKNEDGSTTLVDKKWVGVDDKGIRVVDQKITNAITGEFEKTSNDIVLTDWDWSTDWLLKED